MQPVVFLPGTYDQADIEFFKKDHPIYQTVDLYELQQRELLEILHPDTALLTSEDFDQRFREFLPQVEDLSMKGAWVYYPWSGRFLHCVDQDALYRIRTNRNQNIITFDEQHILDRSTVAVLGLSVGNSIATALTYSGIARRMKLADFDELSTANLNRMRAGLHQVGSKKTDVVAQQIYELDPFLDITLFPGGLRENDFGAFFGEPALNLIFDEIDDFEMKIRVRMKSREMGVPVIMLTSLGDNILIDVERYDLSRDTPLFNGLIGDVPEEILRAKIGEREKIKYAVDLVGAEYIPTRALESLFEINRTLVGRPQLASTINVDGGIASFLARQLLLGNEVPSGRYYVSFADALGLTMNDKSGGHDDAVAKLNGLIGR